MSKYEVLNPLSIGGRRERGEIIELKDEVAKGFDSLDLRKIDETEPQVESEVEETTDETEPQVEVAKPKRKARK